MFSPQVDKYRLRTGLNNLYVGHYNWSKHCACSTSLDENDIARSILLRLQMSEKEVALFFNFTGVCFLTFFDSGETEQARSFPFFSHKPHAKQDHMGGPRMAISCS